MKKIKLLPVLVLLVFSSRAQNVDINLLKHINNADITSGTYHTMRFFTNSAAYVDAGIPVLLLATGVIAHNGDMQKKAVYLAESLVVSEVFTVGLKTAVNRPRPFVTYPFIVKKSDAGSQSFPSGHTSFAFASATSLTIAYPEWYVIVPSFAFAGVVGYSRMYLGVHYPSDVLAGAIVGSGSAWLTYEANKWLHHSRLKKLSTAW